MSKETVEELKAQIAALKQALKSSDILQKQLKKQIVDMADEIDKYKTLIERLKENFDIERYMNFGSTSEHRSAEEVKILRKKLEETKVEELESDDQDLSSSAVVEEQKAKKRWGRVDGVKTCGRNMDFSHKLEKEVIELDIREDLKDQVGRDELVFVKKSIRHQVSFVPSHLRCRETVCYIYKNIKSGNLVYATPKEHDIIKGGKLTNSFIAASIVDKIVWGLPFYRQARRINLMADCNIVDPQLLTRSFLSVSLFLQGLGEELYRQVVSGKSLHADETRILVIHSEQTGQKRLGYFWMLSRAVEPPVSYCRFYPSHNKSCAKELLSSCENLALQTDGYAAYASVVKEMNEYLATEVVTSEGEKGANEFLKESEDLLKKGILLVGCMAHARRRFYITFSVIYKNNPNSKGGETCYNVLQMIGKLYEIEKELRKKGGLSEQEFLDLRKKEAVPIIEKLRSYAKRRQPLHVAEPKLLEAISYLLNQIDTIANYLECAELTPDNNFQERLIKNICTTRKASLFASTEEGARAWALMHSILQTAMLNGVEPTTYLKAILDKVAKANHENVLAKDMDWQNMLPWNFNSQRLETVW